MRSKIWRTFRLYLVIFISMQQIPYIYKSTVAFRTYCWCPQFFCELLEPVPLPGHSLPHYQILSLGNSLLIVLHFQCNCSWDRECPHRVPLCIKLLTFGGLNVSTCWPSITHLRVVVVLNMKNPLLI